MRQKVFYRVSTISASAEIFLTRTMKYFDNLRRYFCSKRCFIGSLSLGQYRVSGPSGNPTTLTITDSGISSGSLIAVTIIMIHDDRNDDDHDLSLNISAVRRLIYQFQYFAFLCGNECKKYILKTVVGLG